MSQGPRIAVLERIEYRLDPGEVLRLLGYVPGRRVPAPAVLSRVGEMTSEALDRIEPRGCYTIQDLLEPPGSGPFRGAERVGYSVCTIGRALEERVAELTRADQPLRALILDAIGSAAVEAVADVVNAAICAEVGQRGVFTNRRISPGYRSWPIEGQAEIFALLPTRISGVSLKRTWFMEPRKSISAAVSVGRGVPHSKYVSICAYCDLRDCAYRRRDADAAEPVH
jgi:cobalamin-dependent methionine synthase I